MAAKPTSACLVLLEAAQYCHLHLLTIGICMPPLLSNSVPPINAASVSAAAYPRESPGIFLELSLGLNPSSVCDSTLAAVADLALTV